MAELAIDRHVNIRRRLRQQNGRLFVGDTRLGPPTPKLLGEASGSGRKLHECLSVTQKTLSDLRPQGQVSQPRESTGQHKNRLLFTKITLDKDTTTFSFKKLPAEHSINNHRQTGDRRGKTSEAKVTESLNGKSHLTGLHRTGNRTCQRKTTTDNVSVQHNDDGSAGQQFETSNDELPCKRGDLPANVRSSQKIIADASLMDPNLPKPPAKLQPRDCQSTVKAQKHTVMPINSDTNISESKALVRGKWTTPKVQSMATFAGKKNRGTSIFPLSSRKPTLSPSEPPPTGVRTSMRSKTSLGHHPPSNDHHAPRLAKSARPVRQRAGPGYGENIVTQTYVRDWADRLDTYVIHNNLHKFESAILSLDMSTRQRVVNFKSDPSSGSSVFFRACQLSRQSFVELMLKECNPDLEETGVFTVGEEPETMIQVTPLWCAAVRGNLDLVRLLTSFGSDVNATSATGSSVVKAACSMSHLTIVSFLIAHGANIHVTNHHGISCLMSAVLCVEVTKLLIHHGAKIPQVDMDGNTALHYAAGAGQLGTVKLLVEVGASPSCANFEKCSVIQTAARYRHGHIVEYLLKVASPPVREIIDAYFMLGAMTIIVDNYHDKGVTYWEKAMNLSRIQNQKVIFKPNRNSALSGVFQLQEVSMPEDMSDLASNDPDALCGHALAMYERLRGTLDDSYMNLLIYRGAISADNKNFRLAVELWKTSYQLQVRKHIDVDLDSGHFDLFKYDTMKTLSFLVQVLYQISHILNNMTHEDISRQCENLYVPETTVRALFKSICSHIFKFVSFAKHKQVILNSYWHSFDHLMRVTLCMLVNYLRLFSTNERSPDIGAHLRDMIHLNVKGQNGDSLLHMCLDMQTPCVLDTEPRLGPRLQWPDYAILEILTVLGSEPTARNSDGDTVLHLAVKLYTSGEDVSQDTLKLLIRLGAHVDQVNHRGQTAVDLLPLHDDLRHLFHNISLACLAAQVVANYGIPYVGEIPVCLYKFVDLHKAGGVHVGK